MGVGGLLLQRKEVCKTCFSLSPTSKPGGSASNRHGSSSAARGPLGLARYWAKGASGSWRVGRAADVPGGIWGPSEPTTAAPGLGRVCVGAKATVTQTGKDAEAKPR